MQYLRCLQLQQTNLAAEHVTAVEWEKALALQELDITGTDLAKEVLLTLELSTTNIRDVSQCPEKVPSRAFSLLKAPRQFG